MGGTALPRVLVVEDDASIRRFVAMALDDAGITLRLVATLAEARRCLDEGPVRLLISDLMLPDGSGIALLRELVADPQRRAGARLVAFSAGVSAEQRQQLLALGVDEILAKPVALAELEDCVQRALAAAPAAAVPAPAASGPAEAVARFFGGNAALFEAYRASCRQQFVADLQDGDVAAARQDLAALRRLVHSLKTVLLTLGDTAGSALAAAAEADAERGDAAAALRGWQALRATLRPPP